MLPGHGSGHEIGGSPYADPRRSTSFIPSSASNSGRRVTGLAIMLRSVSRRIAIGMVALVLSWLMRLQLGFPGTFDFITPEAYYQFITMHGMIMVIYLLTALFLGGFGNYLIPLMIGARDMVFPYMNMLSFWFYLLAVLVLGAVYVVLEGRGVLTVEGEDGDGNGSLDPFGRRVQGHLALLLGAWVEASTARMRRAPKPRAPPPLSTRARS